MSKNNRENRKVQRIQLDRPLKVRMRSIGATNMYELATRNISPNGFFLEFDSPGRFPFNASSIMEIWLVLGDKDMVFFNGKMTRVVNKRQEDGESTEQGAGIAIRIVQIDKDNEEKLRQFIQDNLMKLGKNSQNIA